MGLYFVYAWLQFHELGDATPTYDVYDSDNYPLVRPVCTSSAPPPPSPPHPPPHTHTPPQFDHVSANIYKEISRMYRNGACKAVHKLFEPGCLHNMRLAKAFHKHSGVSRPRQATASTVEWHSLEQV